MRTGTRIAVGVALLGVVVVVSVATWLYASLDALVARRIENQGAQLLGTEVDVDGVEIDLRSGTGTIRGLRVANPPGFSDETAIALEGITVQIDRASVRSDPLRLPRVLVGRTRVRFEIAPGGETNIGVLRRHAQGPVEPVDAQPGEPRRLRIDHLSFDGGEIVTQVPGSAGGDQVLALPRIALADLGGPNGGTPGEIGRQATLDLTRRVVVVVAGSELRRLVKEQVGGLLDRVLQ